MTGLFLFLPVPLVLWLITAQPLGPIASLGLGVLLVLTHRLYARPWALAHAGERCLWCGSARATESIDLEEPLGLTRWATCSKQHAHRVRSFLGWAGRHRALLKIGILGSLLALFTLSLLSAFFVTLPLLPADGTALFRLGVALVVLPLGWLGPGAPPVEPKRLPFPVHIQALVGTLAVSWLFRLVGLAWLGLGLHHLLLRLR